MINLLWLKTFCTLADVGHFTHTAEQLFMTQSGVSQHIKKLEQQLDVALLIRTGKSFSLTEAGINLQQRGRYLLNNFQDLAENIKLDEPHKGVISIASPGSVGLKLYPKLVELQNQHNALAVDYRFAPNVDIEKALIEQRIDIGLMNTLCSHPDVDCEELALEPLVLVTANDVKTITWPALLALGIISHPDAQHHTQLLMSKNYAEFKHIEQFKHRGFSNQISLILEPVSRGIGFTVLPLHAVNAFYKSSEIKVHPLAHPVSEPLYICHNRHKFKTQRYHFISSTIRNLL